MHYRNGREAKNGDKLVKLNEKGQIVAFGVLHSATPGNDYCNGGIAIVQSPTDYACMVDCMHIDDVAELLKEKGTREATGREVARHDSRLVDGPSFRVRAGGHQPRADRALFGAVVLVAWLNDRD